MNEKILFVLSLIGILILLLISKNSKRFEITGNINQVDCSENRIILTLDNFSDKIVIFTDKIIILKKGEKIKIIGLKEKYQNKTQIIADKIIIIE